MSNLDQTIQAVIREEIAEAVRPIAEAVTKLQEQGSVLTQLSALFGGSIGAKRGPGRPRKIVSLTATEPKVKRKYKKRAKSVAVATVPEIVAAAAEPKKAKKAKKVKAAKVRTFTTTTVVAPTAPVAAVAASVAPKKKRLAKIQKVATVAAVPVAEESKAS